MTSIDPVLIERFKLQGSLLDFIQVFYKLRTGRPFVLSNPMNRESHYITICRELVKVFRLETNRLIINVPPGHGKSTILAHFVAWAMSQYPDSQFLYISYSKSLAEKHTATIKQIMEMPHYTKIFDVHISPDSSAKGNFKTIQGGTVAAFGSSGGITGQDAGLPNQNRFSGMVIIDDAHKPDEVHSDTIRESVIQNYNETIKPRPRGENVPISFIGQCLHEADLAAYLKSGADGFNWKQVVLKAIDDSGNALCPNINSLSMLRNEQQTNPYVFAAQYQQDPQPAGGGIFKKDWFVLKDYEPEILCTFITCDSAETEKAYNDATVFSMWGVYRIMSGDVQTPLYGLHWILCEEHRVEPKHLKGIFLAFWHRCLQHKVPPHIAAIEKKSTGVTLLSMLEDQQGLQLIDITPSNKCSKIDRFLECQPYVGAKLISLPTYGSHTDMCLEQCRKVTANNAHAFDDIADTMEQAIRLTMINKFILSMISKKVDNTVVAKKVTKTFNKLLKIKGQI